jgi:fibro-slime domain-containing protein
MASVWLAGCDCAGPLPGAEGSACESDDDCNTGLVCADGTCRPDPDRPDGGSDDGGGIDGSRPPRDTGPGDVCGDSMRTGAEGCDDGNTDPSDGCSASCAIEDGYVCPTPGTLCTPLETCGDGLRTASEACDDRNTDPGDGCDASCALEPGWVCPIDGIACRAAACGDGIVAGFEECEDDDAPPASGDGCSDACLLEDGYACDTPGSPCRVTVCGDGVTEGTEQCDDMNNDLGDGCNPFCQREPMCMDGTCTTVCGDGIVLFGEACDDGNTRNGDGCSSACAVEDGFTCMLTRLDDPPELVLPIVYRDFRGRDLSGGHPDFQYTTGDDRGILATMFGADAKPVYARGATGTSPTTNGQAAFDQWYRDTPGVNVTIVETITLARSGAGTYVFDNGDFFPLDGRGWVAMGMEAGRTGGHNFHFTSEVRYWFQYEGDEVLSFRGDDDVWVFINGRLALDLGGVHGAENGSVTLDATAAGTLGLTLGGTYEVAVFQAERHTTQSSYRLTLSNFTASLTSCEPICGDGIVTRYEACDDGVNDGSYGGCMPGCLAPGPRCGDGVLQTEEGEACDMPPNVGAYGGCNPDCSLGPRCGDGITQAPEECDDGNTVDDDTCTNLCASRIF